MNAFKKEWDNRANQSQDSLQGVLFKNFPLCANQLLHEWHVWLMQEIFSPKVPRFGKVLDLGCGYGRLSNVLQAQRNDLEVVGQDFSEHYCEMYRSKGRLAVSADQSNLPFEDSSFDAVFSVTSLMYSSDNINAVMTEVFRVLKPGGLLFAIDPGEELHELISAVKRNTKTKHEAKGFSKQAYLEIFNHAGFDVILKGGNPCFSLSALCSLGKFKPIKFISKVASFDKRAAGYWKCALHRWVLLKK